MIPCRMMSYKTLKLKDNSCSRTNTWNRNSHSFHAIQYIIWISFNRHWGHSIGAVLSIQSSSVLRYTGWQQYVHKQIVHILKIHTFLLFCVFERILIKDIGILNVLLHLYKICFNLVDCN